MEFGQNQGPRGAAIVHPDRGDAATCAYITAGLPQVFPEGPPSPQARAVATRALAGVGRPESQAWSPEGSTLSAVREAFSAGGARGVGAALRAASEHGAPAPQGPTAPVQRPRINRGTVREIN
jgi:hypothetical protein